MLPNFIIAGATRSGTTSLYYYLKQHHEISFPSLKEPRYFSSWKLTLPQLGPGDDTVAKKLITDSENYHELYKGIENKMVGDASSEYLYHYDMSTDKIFEELGDIPIIIILRNPVERAFSAFNNLKRDGREKETFENGLKLEEVRIQNNWDMMWAYKDVGLYSKQIEKFIATFSNIKILFFEEFVENPSKQLKEIFEFLNVDSEFIVNTETKYSHSGTPTNRFVASLTNRENKIIYNFREFLFNIFPRKYFEKISKKLFKKDDIKSETRLYLETYFSDDLIKIENILNAKINFWRGK